MAKNKTELPDGGPKSKKFAMLQKVCSEIQKKYGKESVNFLGNSRIEPIPRLKSGSVAIDRITGGGYPLGRIIELFGGESSGKCLVKETRVLTSNGYKTIEDIFREVGLEMSCVQKDVPISYPLINMDGEVENTTHFVFNGRRKTYRVRTVKGTEITGTAKHPLRVLTKDGIPIWKPIGMLEPGDLLIGMKDGALREEDKYFNDSVESVEYVGELPVFDFAMSMTHSFIAEGIINHNTTACYHAIAEAQRTYPDKWCGFVDSEYGFDPVYANAIGVKVDELVVAQPDSGTDAFSMVQSFIENGASLIVVDSVAAMVPREEVEEDDYGKSSVGTQARMMSKALRKLTSIVGKSQCVLMFTNQTREKVGVMYGCFHYGARVNLENGETKKIGWIVNNRYKGKVRCVNLETGEIEYKPIVNWFDNGKAENWYKVCVQKGAKQGIARFVVGDDHTFITPSGERRLSELKVGDKVYVNGYHYLSDTDMGLIVGGVLGDGSVSRRNHKRANPSNKCSYRVCHGLKQSDYCRWKCDMMSSDFIAGGFKETKNYGSFESRKTEELEWLCKYKKNSALVYADDELLSKMDLLSLAIWYLDDGTYSGSHAKWGKGKSSICCKKLEDRYKTMFIGRIEELTGARFSISNNGISASGENSWKFQSAIAPYVPKCMAYKMHQDLHDRLETFSEWHRIPKWQCLNVGEIISIDRDEMNTRSTHKFDIQIQDNSNYFVDDVLVHNSPETTSGGKALQFYASIRLKVSKIGVIEEGSGDSKEKVSIRTRIETVKNKTYPPFKRVETEIVFGKGINNEAGVVEEMIERGLIGKKGGWYSIDGVNVAQGIANLKAYLQGNQELYGGLKAKLTGPDDSVAEASSEVPADSDSMTDDEIAAKIESETESGEI